jgi:hypothetical protein
MSSSSINVGDIPVSRILSQKNKLRSKQLTALGVKFDKHPKHNHLRIYNGFTARKYSTAVRHTLDVRKCLIFLIVTHIHFLIDTHHSQPRNGFTKPKSNTTPSEGKLYFSTTAKLILFS